MSKTTEFLALYEDDVYHLANAARLIGHFRAAQEPVTFAELVASFTSADPALYERLPLDLADLGERLEAMLPIDSRDAKRAVDEGILRLYGDRSAYTVDRLRHTREVDIETPPSE
jgi:hypothetical protein